MAGHNQDASWVAKIGTSGFILQSRNRAVAEGNRLLREITRKAGPQIASWAGAILPELSDLPARPNLPSAGRVVPSQISCKTCQTLRLMRPGAPGIP